MTMSRQVTHLIVGLGKGGAETMLYQVLKYGTDPALVHRVVSLGASHYYEEPIHALGIEVKELPLRYRPLRALQQLFHILRQTDTLCCWMYHANFFGWFVGRAARVPKIIWCIRHSNLDPALNSRNTLHINEFCAKRSRGVAAIAYNGEQARKAHEEVGYCKEKGVVLDNGCDCAEYAPDPQAAAFLRQELELSPARKIVLSVSKNHPIKDIPTFLHAFARLHHLRPETVAVLCGSRVEPSNESLCAQCHENGLVIGGDVFLMGLRHDVPRLLTACDLYVMHSAGEAFPNVLVQAMSCGCVCLTTDVGDARRILNQDEFVVPPGNAEALCTVMEKLLALDAPATARLRIANRQRVLDHFDIRQIVRQYEELF